MTKLRAIIAGLIALSLAASPAVAAQTVSAMAVGMPSSMAAETTTEMSVAMTHDASHDECCHSGAPCEKPVKNDCDQSGACMAKCSLIQATTVSTVNMVRPARLPLRAAPTTDRLQVTRDNPPYPPPRH